MIKDNVSGYKKIRDGFRLGVAGFVVLVILAFTLLLLSGLKVITDSSRIYSIFEAVRRILPILSMVLILNGIVETGSETDNAKKAKMWFTIRLILYGCATVVLAFSNLINERFKSETNLSNYIYMFLFVMITSISGYILYYLSYIYLMKEYENVVSMYGFDEEMLTKIKRSEVLLKISCAMLAITEMSFFVYICIVVGLKGLSGVNRVVVLLVVFILSIAMLVRAVNYVMMLMISDKIAKDIEEISH